MQRRESAIRLSVDVGAILEKKGGYCGVAPSASTMAGRPAVVGLPVDLRTVFKQILSKNNGKA